MNYPALFPLTPIRRFLSILFASPIKKLQASGGVVFYKKTQQYAVLLDSEILVSGRVAILAPQHKIYDYAWLIEEKIAKLPLGIEFAYIRDLEPIPPSSPCIELLLPLQPLGTLALSLQLEIEKLKLRARQLANLSNDLQSTSFEQQFINCQKAIQYIENQHRQATYLITEFEQVVEDFRVILDFNSFAKQECLLPPISQQEQKKIGQDKIEKINTLVESCQKFMLKVRIRNIYTQVEYDNYRINSM